MWSGILVLDGSSIEKGVAVLVVSCGLMNLLLWNLFKAKKNNNQTGGPVIK
jgi:hypothetical protein